MSEASGKQSLKKVERGLPIGLIFIIVIGAFMSVLDSSIVNVAIPRLMAVFGVSSDEIQWVLTGYLLASGVVIPLSGFLCDRFGHKRMYVISLIAFTIGSLLCGMAWNNNSMIAFRVIQALGGGLLIPVSMALIYFIVPLEKIGIGLGIWGIGMIMGPAIGPTLGGYLVDSLGWQWIFLVNVPVGIMGVFLSINFLQETPLQNDIKIDLPGSALIIVSCFSLLLALSQGQEYGWGSQYIVSLLLIALFTLILFVLWESQVPNPLIDMRLFKNVPMIASLLAISVGTAALISIIFLVPIYSQNLLGYTAMDTGILMLPMAMVTGIMMPISGKLFDKFGASKLVLIGMVSTAGLTYYLHTLSAATSFGFLQFILAVRAIGIGLMMMPITNAGMATLPQYMAGRGSALVNTVRQIAASLAIAYTTYLVSQRQAYHLAMFTDNVRIDSVLSQTYLNQLQAYLMSQGLTTDTALQGTRKIIDGLASQQAAMNSICDCMVVIALITLIGLLFVPFLSRKRVDIERKRQELIFTVKQ